MMYAIWLLGMLLTWSASFAQGIEYRGNATLSPRTAVDAVGSMVYSAGVNNFAVVDIANPTAPVIRGQIAPNVSSITGIDVGGNFAYCAGQASGLVVIEVTNPNQPAWRVNRQLAAAARDVAVHDTLVGVATATNVTLVGVRNPLNPRILATYPHASSWIEFEPATRRLHVGSTSGAFALQINTNISGNDTTLTLSLFNQFDSQSLTPVAFAAPYVNGVRDATVRVINATTYNLAGQYTSIANIGAIVSGHRFSFIGLATGVVQYLNQSSANPQFVGGASVPGPSAVTGLALGNAGAAQLVVASHGTGLAVFQFSAPTAAPDVPQPLPGELSLAAYPNPFNGTVTLSLAAPRYGEYTLSVFDNLGREVERRQLALTSSAALELDFSGRAAGYYHARLTGAGGDASLRLIYLP